MASRLQEYLLQQPLYAAGGRAGQEGSSMAPVRSPWEGLARAMQGVVGGAMQGYALHEAKGAERKDNEALAAFMKNPDDPALAAAAADHPMMANVMLSRMNTKDKLAAAMQAREDRNAHDLQMKQLIIASRQGHTDPVAAANAHADAQIRVNEAKAAQVAAENQKATEAMLRALGVTPSAAPPTGAPAVPQTGPVPNGALPTPNPALPPMRMVPQGAIPSTDQKAEALPPGGVPPVDTAALIPASAPMGDVPGVPVGQGGDTPVPATGVPPGFDMTGRTMFKGKPVKESDLAAFTAALGNGKTAPATWLPFWHKMTEEADKALAEHGKLNTAKPPGELDQPQKLPEQFREMVGDAGHLRTQIDNYEKVMKESGGGNLAAYINNPQSPEAQKINGAYNTLMMALRSKAFANTGVLQPGEIVMLEKMLLAPDTIRGALATPEAITARMNQFRQSIDAKIAAAYKAHGVPLPEAPAPTGGRKYNPTTGKIE